MYFVQQCHHQSGRVSQTVFIITLIFSVIISIGLQLGAGSDCWPDTQTRKLEIKILLESLHIPPDTNFNFNSLTEEP